MRIVYRNAGETGGLIGLYRFEPLHDMRKLSTRASRRRLRPIGRTSRATRSCRPSNALRETRADVAALVMQDHQRRRLERQPQIRPDIDMMPAGLRDNEVVNAGTSSTASDQKLQGT